MITVSHIPQPPGDVAHRKWKVHGSNFDPQGSLQEQYDQAYIAYQLEAAWKAFLYLPCAVEVKFEIKNFSLAFEGEVRTFTKEAYEVAVAAVEDIISIVSTFAKTHGNVSLILTYTQTATPTAAEYK